jgi:hypothetical protein
LKNVVNPEVPAIHGVAGRTVTKNCLATCVFQQALGLDYVFLKLIWRELVQSSVIKPVTGNLVALSSDAPNQRRKALGDPAKDKKSRCDLIFGKKVEDATRVATDAGRVIVPMVSGDRLLERRNLEVILNVDSERVAHFGRVTVGNVIGNRVEGRVHKRAKATFSTRIQGT